MSKPPSVPLFELLKAALRPYADRGEVALDFSKHGDVVRLPLPGRRLYFSKSPADFRRVLSEKADVYKKSSDYRLLGELIGDGLIVSESDVWRRDRRLLQPLFHQQMLERFVSRIQRIADETLARWSAHGGELAISDELTRIALGVIGHRVFSEDVTGEAARIARIMTRGQRYLAERGFAPLDVAKYLPTPGRIAFGRGLEELEGIFGPIIARRWADPRPDEHYDLLSILKAGGASERSAGEHVRTFFAAGYDTVAAALTWTCHLLGQHPQWQERLAAELDSVAGGRELAFAELRQLPVMRAVIDESLRLYPPAPAIGREATQDEVLSGHAIPKGSTVVLCILAAHRDARSWPDPQRFDPGRFLRGEAPPWAHLPFGAGPRACLGTQFALMELQLVLAALLRRFRLAPGAGPAPKPIPQVALTTSHPLVMKVTARTARAAAPRPRCPRTSR